MEREGIDVSDEVWVQIEERASADTSGLIGKRDQLLAQERKLKDRLNGLETNQTAMFDKLGIKSYDEIDEALAAGSGNADESKKTELELKRYQRELETAKNEKDAYFSQLSSTVIDNQIKSELLKANVKPEMVDALTLQFKTSSQFQLVKDDNGNLTPVNGIGLSPVEAVAEWSNTDVSKVWRSAPLNSGSGAQGANGKGQGKMSMEEISKITNDAARVKALKENGFLK